MAIEPTITQMDGYQSGWFFAHNVRRRVSYWHHKWLPECEYNSREIDKVVDSLTRSLNLGLVIEGLEVDGVTIKEVDFLTFAKEDAWAKGDPWLNVCGLIHDLAPYMEWRGPSSRWQAYLEQGIRIAEAKQDKANLTAMHHLLARIHMRRSDYRAAIGNYLRTIRLARQIEDTFTEGRACTNLGFYYIESGYWWRAEILCCHALKLFEAIGSDHGLAHTHNHLGLLYLRRYEWKKSIHHLMLACEIWSGMEDNYGLMDGYMNLGFLHNSMVEFGGADKAELINATRYSAMALEKADDIGDELSGATILMNLGITHWLAGELIEAESKLKQAEDVFEKSYHLHRSAQVWNNLGLVYQAQRLWGDALHYFKQSLDMFDKLNNSERVINVTLDIAELSVERKSFAQAIEMLDGVQSFVTRYREKQYYHHHITRYKKIRQVSTEALAN